MPEQWRPYVTVAAVIVQRDRFLFVEECIDGRLVLNQPAGHLEAGETLLEAVRRESLEETGWTIRPTALIGIYRYHSEIEDKTFLRFTFLAQPESHDAARQLDDEIRSTCWLTLDELTAVRTSHRSPLVLACVRDYVAGASLPLETLHDC